MLFFKIANILTNVLTLFLSGFYQVAQRAQVFKPMNIERIYLGYPWCSLQFRKLAYISEYCLCTERKEIEGFSKNNWNNGEQI